MIRNNRRFVINSQKHEHGTDNIDAVKDKIFELKDLKSERFANLIAETGLPINIEDEINLAELSNMNSIDDHP